LATTERNRDAAPVTRTRPSRAGAPRIRVLVVDDHCA
jgi:hypothetical protein